MKSTSCFLTVCLVGSVLPLMVQGAELLDRGEGGGGGIPTAKSRSFSPIIIEFESGIINLIFTRDLGEVNIALRQTSGISEFSQTVDTSIQTQASLIMPADTYILTVTTSDGTILIEDTILIP